MLIAKNCADFQGAAPACISHVATVCRQMWGVIERGNRASRIAACGLSDALNPLAIPLNYKPLPLSLSPPQMPQKRRRNLHNLTAFLVLALPSRQPIEHTVSEITPRLIGRAD